MRLALVLLVLVLVAGCTFAERHGEEAEGFLAELAVIAGKVIPAPFGSLVAMVTSGAGLALGEYARRKRRAALEAEVAADASMSAIALEEDDETRRALKRRAEARAIALGNGAALERRAGAVKRRVTPARRDVSRGDPGDTSPAAERENPSPQPARATRRPSRSDR